MNVRQYSKFYTNLVARLVLLSVLSTSAMTSFVPSAGQVKVVNKTHLTQFTSGRRVFGFASPSMYTASEALSGNAILLVDDDDNNPDVRSYYTAALTALGKSYDVWDTNSSNNEPDAATLSAYTAVIWFTGDNATPGSSGETALSSYLTGGGCFLISSQDYFYNQGVTTFMSTYLGVGSAQSDVKQTVVTGTGGVFEGVGTYTLNYPFANWSDIISPNGTAEVAFNGDWGNAAVTKNAGIYRTAYLGFPWEALPTAAVRKQVLTSFLGSCPTRHIISGNAAVTGAILSYTDGTPKTATADGHGNYAFTVPDGWSGTVTPTKAGYAFLPTDRTYDTVGADQTSQDYTALLITYTISGNTGAGGTNLRYIDGTSKTATSSGTGSYSFVVPFGWSGTVTPSSICYTFNPPSRSYSNVITDQTAQDYTPTLNSGCASINVTIAGTNQGIYGIPQDGSTRVNYAGIDSGPLKIFSTNSTPIIAAERDAWAVNGTTTSFAQLMGLSAGQLSDTYVFPAYNNVTLNEQLRFGNVDTSDSTVNVTIGGVLKGSYLLHPSEAMRVNYAGVDSGPVVVQGTSGVHIIAAERDAWAANGMTTSFVQLMGLPIGQVSDTYLFPAYNNVTLNEQLRFGNVDTVDTTVTVTIGGVIEGTYLLHPSQAMRVNYAGVDSGPMVVKGTSGVKIIAAERDAWATNGTYTSFAQLMGVPAGQVADKYLFPAYNNVTLNEQLRFGNVDTVDTTVTVTIGGVLKGSYLLHPSQATRQYYPGVDSGPVVVQGTSGVKIIAAERDAWATNAVTTSFVQLMGLPAGQVSDTYLFPAYNNVTLNEQLRFGVP